MIASILWKLMTNAYQDGTEDSKAKPLWWNEISL